MRCDYCSHTRSCKMIIDSNSSCYNFQKKAKVQRAWEALSVGDRVYALTDYNRDTNKYNICECVINNTLSDYGYIETPPNHNPNNMLKKPYWCRSVFGTLEEAYAEVHDRGCEVARFFTHEELENDL